MRMVVSRTAGGTALPVLVSDVKKHIRVDHHEENEAIAKIAHTATQEIEQFAQIALLTQTITVNIFDPHIEDCLVLPIGPADAANIPIVTIDGTPFTDFTFVGGYRPLIYWPRAFHALSPRRITVDYQAGFGTTVASIPQDLAQAIMDQAALHYDGRSPMDARSLKTSPHMARVGARYRGVQL